MLLPFTVNTELDLRKQASMEKKALSAATMKRAIEALRMKQRAAKDTWGFLSPFFDNTASRYKRINEAKNMYEGMTESANGLSNWFSSPSMHASLSDIATNLPGNYQSASLKNLAKGVINDTVASTPQQRTLFNSLLSAGNADAKAVSDASKGNFPATSFHRLTSPIEY